MSDLLELKGLGCSPGFITGPVAHLHDEEVGPNQTIWAVNGPLRASTALAAKGHAIGLLAATGGRTSHAASIAREVGLPFVSALKDIALLKQGELVLLDGGRGVVRVLAQNRGN